MATPREILHRSLGAELLEAIMALAPGESLVITRKAGAEVAVAGTFNAIPSTFRSPSTERVQERVRRGMAAE